jgi:hypothetical protein
MLLEDCQNVGRRCSISGVTHHPDERGLHQWEQAIGLLFSFVFLGVLVLALSGCASGSATNAQKPKPGSPNTVPPQWLRTELHLAVVDAEDWEAFLAERVTPRFPGGFTLFEVQDRWRTPQGEVQRIPTRLLVILHPPTHEAEQAIEAIRNEYRNAFGLPSVLRSTTPAIVSF